MNPTHLVRTLPFAIALSAIGSASADETLRYTFEDLPSPLVDADEVENTAPDPAVGSDFGSIFGAATAEVVTGNTVNFNGVRYSIGQSLRLFPAAGTEGTGASGVETGVANSLFGIGPGTAYTAMAWVNFNDQVGDNMIFGGAAGSVLHLGSRDAGYHSGHWGNDTSGGTTVPGEWHHVAYTNDTAGTQSIFVDGLQIVNTANGVTANPADTALLIGSSRNGGSFIGTIDEVKVFDETLDEAGIQLAMVEDLVAVESPAISGITMSARDEITVTIEDFGAAGVVDETLISATVDGTTAMLMATKVGTTTTVVIDIPGGEPEAYSNLQVVVSGETTLGDDYSEATSIRSYALPATLRAGLGMPPTDMWDMIEIASGDLPASLAGVIPAGEDGYRAMVDAVANGTITAQATVGVINHADPDNAGGSGSFNPNLTILTDQLGVDDDNFVTYGQIMLTVPAAGEYTFRITGSEGYALRITGEVFDSVSGDGANTIDPNDPSTFFFPGESTDVNAFAVCDFDVAGNYLVELVSYERLAAAAREVLWAPGSFTSIQGTVGWTLVGDHAGQTFASLYEIPEEIIPEVTSDGGWATRIWYEARRDDNGGSATVGTLDNLMDFYADVVAGAPGYIRDSEFNGSLPTLNHSNAGANAGFINPTDPMPTNAGMPGPAEFNNTLIARARIVVPEDGEYSFQFWSDDGCILQFLDPANKFTGVQGVGQLELGLRNQIFFPINTGNTNTRATIFLTAGQHDIVYGWWQGAGGAHFEVNATSGAYLASGQPFRLLGDDTAGPIVTGLDVTAPGWNVDWIGPALDPPISDGNGGVGVGTFAFSVDDRMMTPDGSSVHDEVNFVDSGQDYGGPDAVLWPGSVNADDNHYAMRGTGTLEIPADGTYYLGFVSDDGAYLDVIGQQWDSIVENVTNAGVLAERTPASGIFDRMITEVGSGNTRTIGAITLTTGSYPLEFGHYEATGGSYVTVVGADSTNYVSGATLLPLGVGRSNDTYVPPFGLGLASEPDNFQITAVSYDPLFGEITITFTSIEDQEYGIYSSLDLITWEFVSNVTGADIETQVNIEAEELDDIYGATPRPKVFVRVGPPVIVP